MNIFTAQNPPEAHLMLQLLRMEGVRCEIRNEALFSLQGELPVGEDSSPHIWLLDQTQKIFAQSIVSDYLKQRDNTAGFEDWRCEHCGETNEGQFAACWQCGEVAPD